MASKRDGGKRSRPSKKKPARSSGKSKIAKRAEEKKRKRSSTVGSGKGSRGSNAKGPKPAGVQRRGSVSKAAKTGPRSGRGQAKKRVRDKEKVKNKRKRPVPKPVKRKPVSKPRKPASRKPALKPRKPAPRKPVSKPRKPAPKPRKPAPRKPAPKPRKPAPKPHKPIKRKPAPKPRKPLPKPRKPLPRTPIGRPPDLIQAQLAAQQTLIDHATRMAAVLRLKHPSFEYQVKNAINQDGSVDVELMISDLDSEDWAKFFRPDPSTGKILALENMPNLPDFWVATFIIFNPEAYEGPYDLQTMYEVYRNEIDIATLYYPIRFAYLINMALAIQNILDGTEAFKTSKKNLPRTPGFIERYGIHPSGFQIRFSWNPLNVRPDKYRGFKK